MKLPIILVLIAYTDGSVRVTCLHILYGGWMPDGIHYCQ